MFVDASALVAILAREPDASALQRRLELAEHRFTSALAVYETGVALARLQDVSATIALNSVERLLDFATIRIVPITAEIGRIALDTFARFGRGHHPARLNMGDCFAYACARSLGVPLLCKGDDFAQTDIELA
jgi:ribonuclease VapC